MEGLSLSDCHPKLSPLSRGHNKYSSVHFRENKISLDFQQFSLQSFLCRNKKDDYFSTNKLVPKVYTWQILNKGTTVSNCSRIETYLKTSCFSFWSFVSSWKIYIWLLFRWLGDRWPGLQVERCWSSTNSARSSLAKVYFGAIQECLLQCYYQYR